MVFVLSFSVFVSHLESTVDAQLKINLGGFFWYCFGVTPGGARGLLPEKNLGYLRLLLEVLQDHLVWGIDPDPLACKACHL